MIFVINNMPNINTRNVPDDLYYRVRKAAAMGGNRIPKGALERFVIRALRRAVENPEPGFGMPKLKLCAACVKANKARAVAQTKLVPQDHFQVDPVIIEPKVPAGGAGIFKHLIKPSVPRGTMAGVEVSPGVWVCSDAEAATLPQDGLSVLLASKEPWHREMCGYKGLGAPDGAEKWAVRRGNRMALNLINGRELPHMIPQEAVEAGLAFISERVEAGQKVLIQSHHGKSRGPSLALLWMVREGKIGGIEEFRKLYPGFEPSVCWQAYLDEALRENSVIRQVNCAIKSEGGMIQ